MVTFCVGVSAKGMDNGMNIQTFVYAKGYPSARGSCTAHGLAPVCLGCENRFTTTISVDSSGLAYFWAVSQERSSLNDVVCTCTTETTAVSVSIPQPVEFTPKAEELGPIACESQIGDPIDALTGNVYQAQTDVQLSTDRGQAVAFTRYYNSFDTTIGWLGRKWRHSYQYTLTVDTASGNVAITEGNGRRSTYRKVDTPYGVEYHAPWGIHDRLEHSESDDSYALITPDDTRYVFDSSHLLVSVVDRNSNAVSLTYTGSNPTSIQDMSGHQLFFSYNNGRLNCVRGSAGDTLTAYTYNANGDLQAVTYPDGSQRFFTRGTQEYDSLQVVEFATSDSVNGYFAYDSLGRATQFFRKDGRDSTLISYQSYCNTCPDSFQTRTAIRDDSDTTIYTSQWAVDMSRRYPKRVVNPNCTECGKEYVFGPAGEKVKVVHTDGVADSFAYDVRGNMTRFLRAANTSLADTTHWQYDDDLNLPIRALVKSLLAPTEYDTTFYLYDSTGNLLRAIESGYLTESTRYRDTTTFNYNSSGQLVRIDGPRRDVLDTTSFVYYTNGDLRYETLANGNTTEYGQRDYLGRRTWLRSANGDTTRLSFDKRGRLLKVVTRAGASDSGIVSYGYNVEGRLTSVTTPVGITLTINRDNSGQIDTVTDEMGSYIRYAYDLAGNLSSEQLFASGGVLRKSQSFLYNDKRQLVKSAGPIGDTSRFAYATGGTLDTVINPLGHRTVFRYDSLQRPIAMVQPRVGDSVKTQYSYDRRDHIIKVIDPDGYEYAFRYDDKSRLILDSSAVTWVTRYGYDPAGNLTWKKGASGDSVAYKYDALNRLTKALYPDSQNVRYSYDGTEFSHGQGRLYKEDVPACSTKYQYDARGRLYQELRWFASDTITYTTSYTYDKDNVISRITYPSGVQVAYDRNAAGNVSQVRCFKFDRWTTLVDNVTYAPFGGPESWTLGNDITVTNRYDARYLIDSIGASPTNVMKWRYSYDSAGNVSQITNCLDTNSTRHFTYSEMDQLLTARCRDFPDTSLRYFYARNSNIDSMFISDSLARDTVRFYYHRNRLDSVLGPDNKFYMYDSTGSVTSESGGLNSYALTYDKAGQLVSVDDGDLVTSFQYDGGRRRVKRAYGTTGTRYFSNSLGQVISEFSLTGQWQCDYVYWNGRLLAKLVQGLAPGIDPDPDTTGTDAIDPGGETDGNEPPPNQPIIVPYFYHLDHLGTPWYMTNTYKTVVWRGEYYPYGDMYYQQLNTTNPHRLPGQIHDQTTGLYYNWHRYYDPKRGRYLQADPIGLVGGMNQYGYAGGNPLRFVDPFGLLTEVIIWQPVSWGKSSFGHVSVNINGTSYSFTPGGWDVRAAQEYAALNYFREGVGMSLKLTKLQESALETFLKNYKRQYKWYSSSSCGDPIEEGLENLGFDLGLIVFPVGLGNTLMSQGMVESYSFYQSQMPERQWWNDAPWTFAPGWWSGLFESLLRWRGIVP